MYKILFLCFGKKSLWLQPRLSLSGTAWNRKFWNHHNNIVKGYAFILLKALLSIWYAASRKTGRALLAFHIFRIFFRKMRFSGQNSILCHKWNNFCLLLYLLRVKSFHIFLKSFPNVNELFKVRIPRDFSLARATQNWKIIEIGMINRPLTGRFSIILGSN